ncbi:MAG: lysophospholipid acyltransferase family protein [bacterium]|nr:lysophospholipid acyltransferase family protein [bacterium]
MIRFIGLCIFLGLFLILSIPVFFVEWIIGKFNPRARDISSLRIVQWAFSMMLWIAGTRITYIGEENIPDGPVLYVGNHRSFFDIPITYTRCKDLTGFVSKKEMEKFPLLVTWMRYLYCLFLDREDIRAGLKTILQAIEHVKNGISIFIFPEGTRNKGEELSLLPFHEGSFKIADKTGCPIIPVSINNTNQIFEAHFPRVEKQHIVVEYGNPIYMKDMDKETRKKIGVYCHDIIEETIKRNANLL